MSNRGTFPATAAGPAGPPVDKALPVLDLFFDASRLSHALGRPARADRMRHKPGVSAVARLQDGQDTPQWIAAYHPSAVEKAEKILHRSRQWSSGASRVVQIGMPGFPGYQVLTGPLQMDGKLHKPLARFTRSGLPGGMAGSRILNYNPFRRVVFTVGTDTGELVCKATSTPFPGTAALLVRLGGAGVPVVPECLPEALPPGIPRSRSLRYYPWFGMGHLGSPGESTATRLTELTHETGRALARLHSLGPLPGAQAMQGSPAARLSALVRHHARLAPALAARLDRIHGRLQPVVDINSGQTLIHGDFSADQVLVDGTRIRLIDFDRCSHGRGASDLGSFAAVELLAAAAGAGRPSLTAALLEGYRSTGQPVSDAEVVAWTAFHLLGRLHEPFRNCRDHWHQEMADRLATIEQIL